MTVATLATILAAVGFGGIATAIISGIFTKKRTGAEAAEIITRAASTTVANFEKDMARSREQIDELIDAQREERQRHREEVDAIVRAVVLEREENRKILSQHVSWDSAAVAALNEHGIKVGPVPPLVPQRHYLDNRGRPID